MSYFDVKLNGTSIYDPAQPGKLLIRPTVSNALGEAGSFSFMLDKDNTAYGSIIPYGSTIEVFEDGQSIFYGRPKPGKRNFYNQKTFRCEGALAFLNDIIIPPMSKYEAVVWEETGSTFTSHDDPDAEGYVQRTVQLSWYLQYVFDKYNEAVLRNDRKLVLRNASINDITMYYDSDYKSCMEILRDEIMPYIDGYLTYTRSGDTTYVDLITTHADTVNQPIKAGANLLDFVSQQQEFYTGVVAKGGKANGDFVSGEDVAINQPITLGGEIVTRYGLICAYKYFPECLSTDSLTSKCHEFLNSQQFEEMNIEASAIDLHIVNAAYGSLQIGKQVVFDSPVHGVQGVTLMISGVEVSLDTGEKRVSLGERKKQNTKGITSRVIKAEQVGKKKEEMDYYPMEGSFSPVTSGGVYDALQNYDPSGGGGGGGDGWIHQIDGVTQETGTINFVTE